MLALAACLVALPPPNFIIVFCDDLGYGDLSCYGNREYDTPNLDRMAREGVRLTDFYVASPACSPSRAALLTGCYPQRVSVPQVLNPDSPTGLNPNETTLPEILKGRGYTTACVGKWHLGVKNLMPTKHGFDEFFGLPYSNDMWPPNGKHWPELHLFRGDKEIEAVDSLDDQAELTGRYTRYALDFMRRYRARPFFLYLAHSMPHVPIAASPKFAGKSGRGLYADTVQEIDDSVGQLLAEVKKLGLDRRTMVIFSSDNGPWRPYGNHAGSPGPFREGKGTTFEAGFRVPGIFRMPGTIPAGRVTRELATTMDLVPTLTAMADARPPTEKIDGYDIRGLLTGKSKKTPYQEFFYYWPGELQAVRSGKWKLHVPHSHRHQTEPVGRNGRSAGEVTERIGLSLYDLELDPGETLNLASKYPQVVERLLLKIARERRELGDTLTKTPGAQVRAPGHIGG